MTRSYCRTPPAASLASAVLTALALSISAGAAPAGAQTSPWTITEFEVVAVEPAGSTATGISGFNETANVIVRTLRQTGADPDLPGLFQSVNVDIETKTAIEVFLHDSAAQMERWGFPAPALDPVVEGPAGRPAYRVYLVENLEDAAGEYHLDCTAYTERVLVLNAGAILSGGRVTPRGYQTIAHELFHAVQHATPFYGCTGAGESVGPWITEGTARAVGWDVAQRLRPMGYSTREGQRWGERDYNRRLPIPVVPDDPLGDRDAYGTSSFWRFLAEYHAAGAKPGPDENPVDYGYLASMFNSPPAARDCFNEGDDCAGETNWVAAQVQGLFGEPLRTVYTNFAEVLAVYGHYRRGIDRGEGGRGDPWRRSVFAIRQCPKMEFRPTPEQRVHEQTIDMYNRNSAQCFEIDVEGFDRDIMLEIKADATDEALKIEHLNAAVADVPILAKKPILDALDPETGRKSGTWRFELPDNEISFVVLTNMADNPSASTLLDGLPLTFTAVEEYASFGSGASGPSAADIDAPLPFELDTVKPATVIMPSASPIHAEHGLSDVCIVQLVFEDSRTKNGLILKMDLEGPLRPGTYDIHDDDFARSEDNPGRFGARFGFGPESSVGQGFAISFGAEGGTVTLDTVTTSFVAGRATIVGENRKPTHCESPDGEDAYYEPRGDQLLCPGPSGMVVQAKFGVIPKMSSGAERLGLSVEQCIESDPAPGGGSTPPAPAPTPPGSPPVNGTPGPGPDPEMDPDTDTEPTDSGSPASGEPGGAPAGAPAGGAPDAETGAAESATPTSAELEAVRSGARWAIIRASGDVDDVIVMDDPTFVGGCDGSTPLHALLFQGLPHQEDFAQFSFVTAEAVGTGQTGAFDLSEVKWDYGVVKPANLPEDTPVRVPDRFDGAGALALATHVTALPDRRIAGVVTAPGMRNRDGRVADLQIEFSTDWSCGITP